MNVSQLKFRAMRTSILLCIITLFIACQKDDNRPPEPGEPILPTVFEGRVFDRNTDGGIAGAEVRLLQHPGTGGFSITEIGKTTTDASGNYKLKADSKKFDPDKGLVFLQARKEGFLSSENHNDGEGEVPLFDFYETWFDTKHTQHIGLMPKAILRILPNTADTTKANSLVLAYRYLPDGDFQSALIEFWPQKAVDFETAGAQTTWIWYRTGWSDSTFVEKTDTIYIKTGETRLYTIDF